MSAHPTSEQLGFRAEVREFLHRSLPEDIRAAVNSYCLVTREQAQRWQRILHARGWAAPSWPKAHGGPGWSLVEQAIFREELANCDAPRFENLGIDLIGPTLIRHGTPQQHGRFLPRILSFDDFWAQGYSEPGAGSDLASLRCAARRVQDESGDHYVINGTKIWQSFAHWSNWVLVLVRTDAGAARKQEGISVLLVDMNTPGLTVRPIRFINDSLFHSQLFFDEVKVPAENLVGAEGQGWTVAKSLLVIERLFIARVAECQAEIAATVEMAKGRGAGGASLMDDEVFARRHAELDIRARALQAAWWPAVRAAQAGQARMADASLLKLQGTELLQEVFSLQLEALGPQALPLNPLGIEGQPNPDPLVPGEPENFPLHYFRYRGITLGGGASEVQREIISKALFSGEVSLHQSDDEGLDEEQAMLSDALHRLLADRYDMETRHRVLRQQNGFDPALWSALAELGALALRVPEAQGGFGKPVADLLPVAQALGGSLVLEPYVWSTVIVQQLLADAATPSAGRSLQRLASGDATAALAWQEDGARHEPLHVQATATRSTEGGWRLQGSKRFVMGGDRAEFFIVSAMVPDEGLALFVLPAQASGLKARGYLTHDGRGAADLQLDSVQLAPEALLANAPQATEMLEQALQLGTLAQCAENVGAMRKALAITIDYLRTREQFGKPLATHQALQHRMVDHYGAWSSARHLVRAAAVGWEQASAAERAERVAAARWMTARAGHAIGLDTVQMHGAVGLQDETPISHYCKRLVMSELLLGDASTHLGRFTAVQRARRIAATPPGC